MAAVAPPASFMDKQTLSKARVLVTGDAMLDRYWFGDAERISPEAPVPVVRISRTEERLGGAANVAVNIASVGRRTSLLCVLGTDAPPRTSSSTNRSTRPSSCASWPANSRCFAATSSRIPPRRSSTSTSTSSAPCSPHTTP